MSITQLVCIAYGIQPWQLSAPDWTSRARFDVTAKIPEGAAQGQVPAMLRALLESRLKLAVHKEKREYPVYALVAGKDGPKLIKSAPASDEESPGFTPPGSPPRGKVERSILPGDIVHMEISRISLPELAALLSFYTDRPVVDETGIRGDYEASFDISQRELRTREGVVAPTGMMDDPEGNPLPASLNRLGLKLEPKKEPIEILVIDHAEQTPTEN